MVYFVHFAKSIDFRTPYYRPLKNSCICDKYDLHKVIVIILLVACMKPAKLNAQDFAIDRIDPPNWWLGMAESRLELLVHGNNLAGAAVRSSSRLVHVVDVARAENPDFIYVTLDIKKNQEADTITLSFLKGVHQVDKNFVLKEKSHIPQPLTPADLIYLAMPDRFANGDTTNDAIPGMNEPLCDRKGLKTRHGGDLQGMMNHVGYLENLGVTALWLNPVLENNQPETSYHGYAITDLYKVDPRLGSNEIYCALSDSCHAHGIKMVMDMIYNHWGDKNWLYKNLPDSNWVHRSNGFTKTNYRAEALMDPHASRADKKRMTDGWFDKHMPDLNQQDHHLAKYLIQNSIWWIETAKLDAFRIDTYAYPDREFMLMLRDKIRMEYPQFFLFGETWVQGSPIQAWFETSPDQKSFNINNYVTSLTDFQLYYAINEGLNGSFGWTTGFSKIQLTLAHDYLYQHPELLVTFLDNHDLSRVYSMVGENFEKWKMAVALLMTVRGIPCIYYGTEILMKNFSEPDALVREDFPGGWPEDSINKFEYKGRTEKENEAFEFVQSIAQWRKKNDWFGKTAMTQFVPEDGLYVYARHNFKPPYLPRIAPKYAERHELKQPEPWNQNILMVFMNQNETDRTIDVERFEQFIRSGNTCKNILTNEGFVLKENITVPANSFLLLEFKRP